MFCHKLPLEMEKMEKNGMSAPWPNLTIQICVELSRKKSFLKEVSCPRVMQHISLGVPTVL